MLYFLPGAGKAREYSVKALIAFTWHKPRRNTCRRVQVRQEGVMFCVSRVFTNRPAVIFRRLAVIGLILGFGLALSGCD